MSNYEELLAFLAPFAEGADGYIGFTKANRSDDPELNKKWGTFHNWYAECAAGDVDLPREVLDENADWEYYFTPAVLAEESRLQSKFQHSNVIWIDFDELVEWQAFDPSPSIVVQTSEKKYHCYWLLDWQITSANDQRYWCKRFLEYFSGGDLSGFDATQLLKLPWGTNLKIGARNEDGTPWAPRVIKFEKDLRYSETAFTHLPEPSVSLVDTVDLSALPDIPDVHGGWQYYLENHRNSIPQALVDKVRNHQDGGVEKRSGVLYNLECELFEVLQNPEDVFHTLLGSPNDKFSADHGARGAALLWKDVNRVAIKQQKSKATPLLSKGLRDILENPALSPSMKVMDGTAYVMNKLKDTGSFIQTTRGECFYIDQRAEAVTLHEVSEKRYNPFASMIRRRFGLNEGAHKSVITGILGMAFDECMQEIPVKFHHFAHYDEVKNLVYVDRYDGYMYMLDGESITLYPHGHDRIYFYQTAGSEFPRPYEYADSYTEGSLDALILDGPNYTTAGMGIGRNELRHLIKTWVASFFFPSRMDTKPIVLIHGAADSGKTTLFQNLSIMFTGDSTFSVTEIPTDVKDFNAQVTGSSYIFYDNVEVNKKEMQVKLAQVATGYTVKNRKLFTNSEMVTEKARCFVGITSRNIDRIQDDVAQRYILIPVHPFKTSADNARRSMSDILKEVMGLRNDLWSELIDFVNTIIKQIGTHGWAESPTSMRMADYANLLDITCSNAGLSPKRIEKFILGMQAEIVAENDQLFPAMEKLLENPTHKVDRQYSTRELYEVLCRCHRKLVSQYNTLNKFTRAISGFMDNGSLSRAGIDLQQHTSGTIVTFSVKRKK